MTFLSLTHSSSSSPPHTHLDATHTITWPPPPSHSLVPPIRWTASALQLGEQFVQLTGDVLLAAAQIAYLGPFTAGYRADAVRFCPWQLGCV
jgi:hypothetical protein